MNFVCKPVNIYFKKDNLTILFQNIQLDITIIIRGRYMIMKYVKYTCFTSSKLKVLSKRNLVTAFEIYVLAIPNILIKNTNFT